MLSGPEIKPAPGSSDAVVATCCDLPTASDSGPAIPRVVHFIWFQGEAHMRAHAPEYWSNVEHTRRLMGSDWQVRLWDEVALEPVITTIAPAVWRRCQTLDRFAMKADLARFCLLQAFGGIYLDVDFVVRHHMAPLADLADGPYLALRQCRYGTFVHSLLNGTVSPRPKSLQTYILVSPPAHPVWRLMINHILTFRPQRPCEPDALYYTRFTCMNALGRAVDRYLREDPKPLPVLYITQLSDYYGRHIGKGEWAGVLTTHGRVRHALVEQLSWSFVLAVLCNLALAGALVSYIAWTGGTLLY